MWISPPFDCLQGTFSNTCRLRRMAGCGRSAAIIFIVFPPVPVSQGSSTPKGSSGCTSLGIQVTGHAPCRVAWNPEKKDGPFKRMATGRLVAFIFVEPNSGLQQSQRWLRPKVYPGFVWSINSGCVRVNFVCRPRVYECWVPMKQVFLHSWGNLLLVSRKPGPGNIKADAFYESTRVYSSWVPINAQKRDSS